MDSRNQDAAIVSLLTQHQSAPLLYVESLMPGDSRAQDVAQEANTVIWEKRGSFELGANFKAWIFTIARYQVRKYRFRQAKESRMVFCDELEETFSEELQEQVVDLSEHHMALRFCLQNLKPSDRQLIYRRYFEGTALKDYASEIGRSVGGLKVSLHRLRNRLQLCVERRLQIAKDEGGL